MQGGLARQDSHQCPYEGAQAQRMMYSKLIKTQGLSDMQTQQHQRLSASCCAGAAERSLSIQEAAVVTCCRGPLLAGLDQEVARAAIRAMQRQSPGRSAVPSYDGDVSSHPLHVHRGLRRDLCATQVLTRHLHL